MSKEQQKGKCCLQSCACCENILKLDADRFANVVRLSRKECKQGVILQLIAVSLVIIIITLVGVVLSTDAGRLRFRSTSL